MNYPNADWGKIIKAARIQRGLTQMEVAKKLGISRQHVIHMENEGGNPSFDVLFHLVRLLNISADLIFYPESRQKDNKYLQASLLLKQCSQKNLNSIIVLLQSMQKDA
jgi:transcriptional regulator with XRE-family HTH domain